jgi:hypothetical protein
MRVVDVILSEGAIGRVPGRSEWRGQHLEDRDHAGNTATGLVLWASFLKSYLLGQHGSACAAVATVGSYLRALATLWIVLVLTGRKSDRRILSPVAEVRPKDLRRRTCESQSEV